MDVLPDTNIIINYLKGIEPESSYLKKFIISGEISFSPVTIAEYVAKAEKKERQLLEDLLTSGQVLSIDEETALVAGEYRKEFSRKTKRTFLPDCLVAATCRIHQLILVTNNIKDYPMKDIKIIKP